MGYKLTPFGDNVAFNTTVVKTPEDAILVYLYEHKPRIVEIEELVGELNSSESKILHSINVLLNTKSPKIQEL